MNEAGRPDVVDSKATPARRNTPGEAVRRASSSKERGQLCPRLFWHYLKFARTKRSALLHRPVLESALAPGRAVCEQKRACGPFHWASFPNRRRQGASLRARREGETSLRKPVAFNVPAAGAERRALPLLIAHRLGNRPYSSAARFIHEGPTSAALSGRLMTGAFESWSAPTSGRSARG